MLGEDRIQQIINAIQKIKASKEFIRDYFKHNEVPFSIAQYYRYCNILQKNGEEGLSDRRIDGNSTKLTQRIKDYIIYIVSDDRSISSSQLQNKILNQFKVKISISSLNSFRASESLTRLPPPKEVKTQYQRSGGGEILTSLAFHTHFIELITKTIIGRVNDVRQSEFFEQNKIIKKDRPDTRFKGKFTREYNQQQSVREKRFRSIERSQS